MDNNYYTEKIELIKQFKSNSTTVKYKSEQWEALMKRSFGGSSMGDVVNDSSSLVKERLGLTPKFKGCPATRWGSLLEYITARYTEIMFNMKDPIDECETIIISSDEHYSPDGLGVIEVYNPENNTNQCSLVLFEFKAPYSKIPDGTISNKYKIQMQTGMKCIPIVEMAVFVSNVYRISSLSDLHPDNIKNYNRIYHSRDNSQLDQYTPKAYGVLYFKIPSDCNSNKKREEIFTRTGETIASMCGCKLSSGITDIGANEDCFDNILELRDSKKIDVIYGQIFIYDDNTYSSFIDYHNSILNTNENIFAFLPWKLICSEFDFVKRDHEVIQKISNSVIRMRTKLNQIKSSDNPLEEYAKLYPPTRRNNGGKLNNASTTREDWELFSDEISSAASSDVFKYIDLT